jgi:SagB-type dehydrogenase family enzyme
MTPDFGSDGRQRAELWSLREDVRVEPGPGDKSIALSSSWGGVTIQRPAPVVREALRRMLLGPISLENVVRTGDDPAGGQAAGSLALLHQVLDQLQPFVIRTLQIASGQPLLSVVPLTPQSRFHPNPLPAQMRVRLSAFAQLRTDGSEYRLESPLSLHRVLLHRPEAVWLLSSIGRPVTVAAMSRAWPQLDSAAADALAYLAAAGMVVGTDGAEDWPGTTEAASLAGWSPADLAFHAGSNTGRHDQNIGRTYPMGRAGSPDPVVKPRRPELGIPLHRPTWERLAAADPPLAVVMEGRRSMRAYGTEPVTAEELGDLLYRAARVRSLIVPPSAAREPDGDHPDPRLSDRPYPAGGACYELELYITVGSCTGIPPGVYHYDPLAHQLEPVDAPRKAADDLLRGAGQAAAMEAPPPVLITMTARYRRLSWKYEGLVYATVLKDVGVMLQNLYLVSTAMRLAPCALGAVNLEATARAFGTDWWAEPSVGQFILGRARETPPQYEWQWEPVNDPQWADQARARLRG